MGRKSDTYVEGWNPGFWDGRDKNGKHIGGFAWFEPDPPAPYPEQRERQHHRIDRRMSIGDVRKMTGIGSVEISQYERGRYQLTPEQEAAYDEAIGYTGNE